MKNIEHVAYFKMLITSNSSPATGEMLEDSVFITDEGEFSTHFVPESSHTIEIQYISHVPELGVFDTDINIVSEPVLEEINTDDETFQCSIGQCIDYREDIPIIQNDSNETDSMQQELDSHCSSNDCSVDSSNIDSGETDLTNLNWLQNITNIMAIPPMPLIAPKPEPKPPIKNARLHKMKQTILKCQEDFIKNVESYQSDCEMKPPFSYCSLICLAMRYNGNIMTLSSIYSWIKDNFKYYRQSDATWQNSIRHNLSLNKMFVKVARSKQEPGKGGFWRLDLARLEDSRRFKRTLTTSKSKKKKAKTEEKQIKETNSPQNNEMESDNNNVSCNNSMESSSDTLNYITGNLPDLSLDGLEPDLTSSLHADVGANVIVEPVLSAEFSSLLLPNPWEELQPDILDSLLDSYLK